MAMLSNDSNSVDILEPLPPFIAGPPISHPCGFFGRRREIKRIYQLHRRLPLQNAAVIGPRRSGKTSLLHYLKNSPTAVRLRPGQKNDWLPQPENYRWLYVDFQDARFSRQDTFLRYLLAGFGLPAPDCCDLDYFLNSVSHNVQTATIVLLDEIDVALQRYSELDDAFWESLRAIATNQADGKLAFVLAAHKPPMTLAQQSGHGSPFFNIFGYSATLGPLEKAEAQELLSSSPIPFPEDDVTWMLQQSGRWPFLLQILARERLLTLEEGEAGSAWRAEGRRQIEPFQTARTGETAVNPPITHSFLPNPLSEREVDVLALMVNGHSNQEIAGRLFVAVSTVKSHVNSIYNKLNVRNRTEAAMQAQKSGLLDGR
jgi:DNA-binding CsgD family transcriptional regulator